MSDEKALCYTCKNTMYWAGKIITCVLKDDVFHDTDLPDDFPDGVTKCDYHEKEGKPQVERKRSA